MATITTAKRARIERDIRNSKYCQWRDDWFNNLIAALERGDRIVACKETRALMGMGLRNALDHVNNWNLL